MKKRIHFVSYGDSNNDHVASIKKVLDAGIDLVQLRIKNRTDAACYDQALKVKNLCKSYGAQLVLNDRVLLSNKLEIGAVHLGQNDMAILKARDILGESSYIGGTANTLDQMIRLSEEGVDYIGLGPYRFTKTKENLSPILGHKGIEDKLNAFQAKGHNVPVYIIGGIVESDFGIIATLPIAGIAVSSLFEDKSIKEIEVLKQNFEKGI